jgi:hypothetical protein
MVSRGGKIMPLNKGSNEEATYEIDASKITENDDYREIDWNKVQLIGDLKVILEKLDIIFSDSTIEENDPIRKYLKK